MHVWCNPARWTSRPPTWLDLMPSRTCFAGDPKSCWSYRGKSSLARRLLCGAGTAPAEKNVSPARAYRQDQSLDRLSDPGEVYRLEQVRVEPGRLDSGRDFRHPVAGEGDRLEMR